MNVFRCVLLLFLCKAVKSRLYENCNGHLPEEFDYIVIGAGTAGSVIANRLSEDESVSVLVLEAGTRDKNIPESPLISTPALWPNMLATEHTWKYKTVPQKHALLGYTNQSFCVEMGKILGGSSSINAMLYTRGFKSDFDSWEDGGAVGWGYNDVLPFFLKAEGEVQDRDGKSFGHLDFSHNMKSNAGKLAFKAALETGAKEYDSRDPNPLGVFYSRYTISSGMRQSASDAYLWPVIYRHNLHVVTGATVEKILINAHERQTEGVLYSCKSGSRTARVRQEVIISAGPYGSPKILMLSGIGPKNNLEEIPVIADLPVGQNLIQHMAITIPILVDMKTLHLPNFYDSSVLQSYIFRRQGPYSALVGLGDVNCFIQSSKLNSSLNEPHANVILMDGDSMGGIFENHNTAQSHSVYTEEENCDTQSTKPQGIITAFPMSARPKSRGFVRLSSKHHTDLPTIDPKFLSSEYDVKVFLESIRFVQKMTRTPSMEKVNARFREPEPACINFIYDTDSYWECYIRHFAIPTYHGVGTCKMGEDDGTVVDSRLRVKGVKRLRVADASIMPTTTSSNTQAAVYMNGEKAADLIKKDAFT